MASRAPRTGPQPKGCIVRALGFYALFLLFPALLWIVGGLALGSWRVRQELQAWADTGTSMDALRARHPTAPDSEAAVGLDHLTRPLGIHLIRGPAESPPADEHGWYDATTQYMKELGSASSDRAGPPPAELQSFLRRHRAALGTVADYLTATPGISWETDIDAGIEGPIPSLLAHRQLQLALLAEALERNRRRDHRGARHFLEAAHRHLETLARRPEIISCLIALIMAGDQQAVLRIIPNVGEEWESRLAERRLDRSVPDTLQAEAYGWLVLAREYRGAADLEGRPPTSPFSGHPGEWLVRFASAPYIRLCTANMSRQLRLTRTLTSEGNLCELDLDAIEKRVVGGIPRWDFITKVSLPSLTHAAAPGLELQLDAERTRRVLEARRRRRQQGDWGAGDGVPSRLCPDVVWRYRRERDGRLTILPEPEPHVVPDSPRQWAFTVSPASYRR